MAELGSGGRASLDCDISEAETESPVVRLRGELDMTTAPELDAKVAPVIARDPKLLVVDASGLEFADSSAIALLVSWANRVPQIEIHNPPELLRRVIARMGLSGHLQVRP